MYGSFGRLIDRVAYAAENIGESCVFQGLKCVSWRMYSNVGETLILMPFRYEKNWQQNEERLQPEETSMMDWSVLVSEVLKIKFKDF